jgi:beta-phosphoglucomutase family hydrolase
MLRGIDAVIFDLDGVVTRTARAHARAWKETFDPYLEALGQAPFDPVADYRRYVDGKPRRDGVRSFLAARGIPASEPRIARIAAKKDAMFREALRADGVEVFETSVALIGGLRSRGVKTAVVSASRHCAAVLDAAGIAELFDARVDGNDAARLKLDGKPAPDTFLRAAELLGVAPARAAVVEDSLAGVEAGRRGGFAVVIGVDRAQQATALRAHGATHVVRDLAELEAAA